jgi:outer membrane protein assembly factor BamB
MHHKNPSRDGLYVQPTFTKAAIAGLKQDTGFSATVVRGKVYAQPLFVDGGTSGPDLVIVATELNNVYALDGATGAQVWTKNLGTPVPLASMSCGNIDPFGVTGTPVIDPASRTMYLSALTLDGSSKVHHQIFALSIDTGAVAASFPIDAATIAAASGTTQWTETTQGSRGALAIVAGTLYVPYGGLYGDCNPYHGWVMGVPLGDPSSARAWATPAMGGGAWSPGGVSSDGTNVYIGTGNTFGASAWGGGDGVVAFAAGVPLGMPAAFWAPTNWTSLDNADLDMGTTPVVFDLPGATPSALAIEFGKDGNAYLLDRNNLGGVADALATLAIVSNEVITAPALYTTATATYVVVRGTGAKCTSGNGALTAMKVIPGSPPTLAPAWCANAGSASPMVTTSNGTDDAIVWSPGAESNNHLNAFDGDTGAPIVFAGSGVSIPNMERFNTPIAAKGRIYVAADNAVVAFSL